MTVRSKQTCIPWSLNIPLCFRSLCRQRHRKTPSFPQFLAGAAADAPAEMLVTQGDRCRFDGHSEMICGASHGAVANVTHHLDVKQCIYRMFLFISIPQYSQIPTLTCQVERIKAQSLRRHSYRIKTPTTTPLPTLQTRPPLRTATRSPMVMAQEVWGLIY